MNRIKTNETMSQKLLDSIVLANDVLNDQEFYKRIKMIQPFDYTEITEKLLSDLISNSIIEANVTIQKSINPFSSVTAFTKPKFPNSIFIYNKYINNEATELVDIACTLVHEYTHLVDYEIEEFDFGHGSNNSTGKENSVPYFIENIAKEIITHKY